MTWKLHLQGLKDLLIGRRRPGKRRTKARLQARLDLELLERRDVLSVFYRAGDFNGDTIPDLVQGDVTNGVLLPAYWNGAPTTLTNPSLLPSVSAPSLRSWYECVVADVNGDGRADLVGRKQTNDAVQVALSTPGSFFAVQGWQQNVFPAGKAWTTLVVGDFNGDRRQDLAARDLGTGRWQVALSTGSGFVSSDWGGAWSPGAGYSDVRAGDFDGDGRTDIAGRDASGSWQVALSSGAGFVSQPWWSWATGVSWQDVVVGDFDGDGRADLVGRRQDNNQLWVSRLTDSGLSSGSWGTAPSGRVGVVAADLNQDGRADLIGQQGMGGLWSSVSLSTGSAFTSPTNNWTRSSGASTFSVFATLSWGDTSVSVPDLGGPARATLAAYNQVRNTVGMEFYPGLKKGALATLETRSGNDWEQAAAVASLLPKWTVGGLTVPAVETQYVRGTIEVPIADAERWTGATQPWAAVNVLSDLMRGSESLVPNLDASGNLISVRFRHTWLEAKLPGASDLEWVRLDPSWKFQDFHPGVPGIRTAVSFGEDAFLAQNPEPTDAQGNPDRARRPGTAVEYYAAQVADYLKGAFPNSDKTVADVPRRGPILVDYPDKLPPQPSYQVIAGTASVQSASDISLQTYLFRLTLQTIDASTPPKVTSTLLQYTFVLPAMSQRAVTVGYIQQGANYQAQLWLDDQVLATSAIQVPLNTTVRFVIEQSSPGGGGFKVLDTRYRNAGVWVAVVYDARQFSDGPSFASGRRSTRRR